MPKEKGLGIYAWCIMSNHIHMAVGTEGRNKIEDIIRDFKKYTSVLMIKFIEENERESRREWMLDIFRKAALESKKHQKFKFWQNEYYPKELFDHNVFKRCLEYIHTNPVKEGIVKNPEDYLFSSAKDYAGFKGLLDVKVA